MSDIINWCNCFNSSCHLVKYRKFLKDGENCNRYINLCKEKNLVPIINFSKENLPKQSSDIAICAVAANEYAQKQLEITRSTIVSYAKKCKADYIELTGDYYPDWPMVNKYRIYQVTSKYQKTLYLDVDIIINEWSPNIFDATPDDKISLYDEQEIAHEINPDYLEWTLTQRALICESLSIKDNDFYIPNGGVMVIPRALSEYYSQPKKSYHKEWCFDQNYLAILLPIEKLNKLNSFFNWSFLRRDFWNKTQECYFIHLNGSRPKDYRLNLLNRLKNSNYEFLMPPDTEDCNKEDSFRPRWFFEKKNANKSL
jgi:hypothetical protein